MEAAGSRNKGILSGSALKIIAIIAMLIDHLGAYVFPMRIGFRWIGRLTFPIMAFFVYEGWRHTRDVKRYALRLLLFALVSEIPFDLAHSRMLVDWGLQNIGFTLLLGLGAIVFAERGGAFYLLSAGCCLLGDILQVDYGSLGVLTVLLFFIFGQMKLSPAWAVAGSTLLFTYSGWLWFFQNYSQINWDNPYALFMLPAQSFAIFTAPLLMLYNGKRGNAPGWLFYVFYPGHLLFLYAFGASIAGMFPNL